MANSYLDLDTAPIIFPFVFNWASRPETGFNVTRYLTQHKGGPTHLEEKNPELPIAFSGEILIRNRQQNFSYLNFIHEAIGRTYRFWVQYPISLFTLANQANNGASSLTVYDNHFHLHYVGFERIFIEMDNGDVLTRHVTDAVKSGDYCVLSLASVLDRDITLTNHLKIGRFLLCRFDTDDFQMTLENDLVSTARIQFMELVKEYPEAEGPPPM